jgi:hypothetical protein
MVAAAAYRPPPSGSAGGHILEFTGTAAMTQRLTNQRRATLDEEARLRGVISAGATADPRAILRAQFGDNWAGLPGSVLSSFLHGLVTSRPFLQTELKKICAEAHKLPDESGTASAAAGQSSGAFTGETDPPGSDPPAGGVPDFGGDPLGTLDFAGMLTGVFAGAAWNALLDWDDLVAGEIELQGWILARVRNSIENQLATAAGAAVGAVFFDPFGAALVGFAAYLVAVRARAARKYRKLEEHNAAYRARVDAIDARYERLATEHDEVVTRLRNQYTSGCSAAVEGMPAEQHHAGIEQAATTLYAATRRLIIAAPRGRQYPGLTRGQRRLLHARLRVRRTAWLSALGLARAKTCCGEFLDMLDLLVTINRQLLAEADMLAETDWDGIARLLAGDLAAWDRATQNWSSRAEAGIRVCLASYQQPWENLQTDFLAARARLMRARLEALLDLVNKSRRLNHRRPLRSVEVMLEHIKSGKLSFKARD